MSDFTGERQRLRDLAAAHRVATEYWGQAGNHVQVPDHTVRAVLLSLGVDAADDAAVRRSLEEVRLRDWRRMIPPVFVTWAGEERRLWVHLPHGESVRAWIVLEDGRVIDLIQWDWWVDPIEVDGVLTGEASFGVPADLPIGWHRIYVVAGEVEATCPLAVAPTALDPYSIIGGRQWGPMVQVYSWPQSDGWGIGDSRALATLADWSARQGAGFVLVNPLHAPVDGVPSPYLPSSRRFLNPLMIRPEDVPEFEGLSQVERARVEELRRSVSADLASGADLRIDRDRSWAAMRTALRMIFDAGRGAKREGEFQDFCLGESLRLFATWNVLAQQFGTDYRAWPLEFQDAAGDPVRRFADEHATDVRFEMWLQWIVSEQLSQVQARCRADGMSIGVITDLAVGVHPGGADAWALADVLAPGIGVGAPPDMYNQQGQNWDQPPWRPDSLAEAAFAPLRDVLRAALHGAGGVRIDHILGLFRMWWIPKGNKAIDGTYVGFDHDAMLAIVCLEAYRAGAIVIGEDLGTVEPWVQSELARRGILGTVISWFERDGSGNVLPMEQWRAGALASVTVHDLPPTAGYLAGEHVRIRSDLGLLTGSAADEWAAAERERGQWANLLRERGYLRHDANLDSFEGRRDMVVALHRALSDAPSVLVGVGVPDLVGDLRAQNQPGTDQEYPNWRMPVADPSGVPVTLEAFVAEPGQLAWDIVDSMRR